jgi:hypothetical protein
METQTTHNKRIMPIVIIIILLILGGIFLASRTPATNTPVDVACTMEAKLCPDGSSVGRSGPKCEFAACPENINTTYKTFDDTKNNLTFTYPEGIAQTYISTVDWPPKVQVLNQAYSCSPAGLETDRAGITEEKTLRGHAVCITRESEGAAGSTYTNYAYSFAKDQKTVILTFSLRFPQCANYPDPEETVCSTERQAFNIDNLLAGIIESLTFK